MSWPDAYVFAAVPLGLATVWWIFRRARGTTSVASFANIKRLWADRRGLSDSATTSRRRARGIFLALGTLSALAALARPQWGTIEEPTFDQAREVMIALDLSRSMLADDVKPTRLARAKLLIESLLEQLKGERVGLIVFAGTAFVQSPLSADYEVMRDLLKDLDPSYLPQGGTNYGAMLSAAASAFGQTGDGDRFLVVLSDGEAHDDNWQSTVAELKSRGIRVIGLGVGTAAGAVLPDGKGGLLKDNDGGAVLSRLEPGTLQQLAEQTHGVYRDAATWVDIADLVRSTVDQGVKGQYVEQKLVHRQDRFQWFLAPALLFFLLSYWIDLPVFPAAHALRRLPHRPQPAQRATVMNVARAAMMLLAALLAPHLAFAAQAQQPNPLETTVAELSAKPALAPTDYARLARQTIQFASQPNTPADPTRAGVIDDALTAVNLGDAADAHAADWPVLRKQLEQLRQAQQHQPKAQPPQGQQHQKQNTGGGQQEQQNARQGNQPQQAQGNGQSQAASKGQQGAQSAKSGEQHGEEQSKSQPGGSATNDRRAGNDQADKHGTSGSKADDTKKEDGKPDGNNPQHDASTQREVAQNNNQKPLASPDAGFGKLDAPQPQDASRDKPASQPTMRMVGGGGAQQDKALRADPALADAVGKMERVKDGDAPSVLFERMSRADNPHPPRQMGKNW
jgi:Ca-activated chloride channel family protein